MDLTRQPPRRPSNTGMAGIAGLARMADKARGHKAELIGEFKYGEDSGLDREVLALIGVSAADFADAAETLWDAELADWVRDRMSCTAEEIEAFDEEQTTRRPQDDLHRRLLKERVAKYAPGSTGVTTVYASIELDDWGAFRDQDLTARPPRSGYVRSVLGLVAAARMADKARAHRAGRMGDYRYGDDSFFDRTLLELLGLTAADFEEGAWRNPNDTELGEWILGRVEAPRPGAVSALNARLARHGEAHPEWRERFGQRRDEICPERRDLTTYFELQDIDDQGLLRPRRPEPAGAPQPIRHEPGGRPLPGADGGQGAGPQRRPSGQLLVRRGLRLRPAAAGAPRSLPGGVRRRAEGARRRRGRPRLAGGPGGRRGRRWRRSTRPCGGWRPRRTACRASSPAPSEAWIPAAGT